MTRSNHGNPAPGVPAMDVQFTPTHIVLVIGGAPMSLDPLQSRALALSMTNWLMDQLTRSAPLPKLVIPGHG